MLLAVVVRWTENMVYLSILAENSRVPNLLLQPISHQNNIVVSASVMEGQTFLILIIMDKRRLDVLKGTVFLPRSILWGHRYPQFLTLNDSAHEFQSQGGSIVACALFFTCFPESSLVAGTGCRARIASPEGEHDIIAPA